MNNKQIHLPETAQRKQRLLVFTGAGISVESGLSTYRGKDGLDSKYDYEWLSSSSTFDENPSVVLDFHNMLRRRLLEDFRRLAKDNERTVIAARNMGYLAFVSLMLKWL